MSRRASVYQWDVVIFRDESSFDIVFADRVSRVWKIWYQMSEKKA